jgi:alpha-ketoglutaric semialdehyde dehydrogenase
MNAQKVLINGAWVESQGRETFQAVNPQTGQPLAPAYPVSPWSEVDRAVQAASSAAWRVRGWPGERFAAFLDAFAGRLEQRAEELIATAQAETALAVEPRLKSVELPRTVNQLRQAAAAARDGSWVQATIDSKANIRSMFAPIGPVVVFGPNNFPFAFNGAAGGDFAAAVAAGNPVIAKGHTSHPGTSRLLAEEAHQAALTTDMPAGFVQLIYRTSHTDGERLVVHPLIGATGYTGSRQGGLRLKEAADRAGKAIYLELSSVNPVFVLPGALNERLDDVAQEFATSCLMGTGQFCTNPGLVALVGGESAEKFIAAVAQRFTQAPTGTLLGEGVRRNFVESVGALTAAGAKVVTGGGSPGGPAIRCENTLLRVDGDTFLAHAEALQTEAFGNESLFVVAKDAEQLLQIAGKLEGNLTGCVYSHRGGLDDPLYDRLSLVLRERVGRLLNDKMPTGVAVSPAMNHGGPFPATGHRGFTAVGIPAALHRFAALECYDNVRPHRLPPALRDANPTGRMWRFVDGTWTQACPRD